MDYWSAIFNRAFIACHRDPRGPFEGLSTNGVLPDHPKLQPFTKWGQTRFFLGLGIFEKSSHIYFGRVSPRRDEVLET